MGSKTTNYNLNKPAQNDFYNIDDHNQNMDIIDGGMKSIDDDLKQFKNSIENGQIPDKAIKFKGTDDLNDFTNPGFYFADSSVVTNTIINKPTSIAFGMIVMKTAGIVQIAYEHMLSEKNKNRVYVRAYYNYLDKWNDWWEVASLDEVQKLLNNKVDKMTGMGLSQHSYTTLEKEKLNSIDRNAQVNVIESVKVNNTALTVTDKTVNVSVPTVRDVLNSTDKVNALSAAQGKVLKDALDGHINDKKLQSVNGIHGIRYHEEVLSYYDGTKWVEIETGGSGIAPNNVLNPTIKVGNGKLTLSWSDPGDTVVDGQLLATWAGTKLVQKAGSYPENVKDGTLVLDNKEKDAYAVNGFEIGGLTNGTTYYFQLFPYSDKNAVNENVINRLSAAPRPFRTMTAIIDLSNSNPASSVTYSDDAIGMTPGDDLWDEFFGHYPVILKDGIEGVRLNPNDFTKDLEGNTVNLASSAIGDVMIAFPRRGVKISTVGTSVTIKMTDDPNNADFEYNAHRRGSVNKDIFYLGAYKGFLDTSKLRSWSGKAPTTGQTIGAFRTQAQANGAGYDQSGFYQLTFRQAMYVLKYKNLDSQTTIGRGYVDENTAAIATGGTDKKGMDFGETTGKLQMKLFGLEDFWGNVRELIDGLFINSTRNILTATENFNDTGAEYVDHGQGATANISGYMSKIQGSSDTGFITKEGSGSETTYFCDFAHLNASRLPYFGRRWSGASSAGAFSLCVDYSTSASNDYSGSRLMYL